MTCAGLNVSTMTQHCKTLRIFSSLFVLGLAVAASPLAPRRLARFTLNRRPTDHRWTSRIPPKHFPYESELSCPRTTGSVSLMRETGGSRCPCVLVPTGISVDEERGYPTMCFRPSPHVPGEQEVGFLLHGLDFGTGALFECGQLEAVGHSRSKFVFDGPRKAPSGSFRVSAHFPSGGAAEHRDYTADPLGRARIRLSMRIEGRKTQLVPV